MSMEKKSRSRLISLPFSQTWIVGSCLILFLLITTPLSTTCFANDSGGKADLRKRVESTLARHVEGAAIGEWLSTLESGSLKREAAEWILAWLPLSDLVSLDLSLLQEHVLSAVRTYHEVPWRDRLPREIWLRFVVPHRVSQEPVQPWRRVLHDRIWPRIANAGSMEEAALAVNRWCREQATFISTSRRDMGPLTTITRGLGRCEEEMILTISAMRSVGIPARGCSTPYWTFTDNNHAWVEVWADGQWYYMGGCEPAQCLNRAWFSNAAQRTGFVRSVAFGQFDPDGEPLYRTEKGSTIINSTAVYTRPFTLTARAEVEGIDRPEIRVNVFNFGSLRPIAWVRSGESIELGSGEYALTTGREGELLMQVVSGRPGEKVETIIDSDDLYDMKTSPGFWLCYPEGEERPMRDLDLVSDEEDRLMKLRVRAGEEERKKLHTPSDREKTFLDSLDQQDRARLETILEKPMESVSTVFLLLEWYQSERERTALLDFLERADDKDLLELDESAIRSHMDLALSVRFRLEETGLVIPDSIFHSYVLACRINREPGGPWRESLPLVPLDDDPMTSVRKVLTLFRHHVREEEKGFFGAPLNPGECWRLGLGTKEDLDVCLVGLLRRNGFPARYRFGAVEVWIGDFIRLDPLAGDLFRKGNEGEKSAGRGRLAITITRGGLPYEQAESWRHFMVCRPDTGYLESPYWDPSTGEQEWDAGDYILCSGLRVPGGSVYVRMRAFTVIPDSLTEITLPVDVKSGEWDSRAALISGPPPDSVLALLNKTAPLDSDGRPLPERGLFFLFVPGEPASRMINALGNLVQRLEKLELSLIPVLVGSENAGPWREALVAAGYPDRLWLDPIGKLRAVQDESETFEALVMLKAESGSEKDILLLRQGFDSAVDATVHLALDYLAINK